MDRNSVNNTIGCNTISDNTPGGIYIEDSSQNTIFNNNFINNTDSGKPKHVYIFTTPHKASNVWDSGYPHGGNYWDDWNDTARQPRIVDEKSGWNHAIYEPDGIGDTPYNITGDTRGDEYPLLNLFNTSKLRIMDTPLKVSRLSGTETKSLIVAVFGDFAEIGNFTFSSTTEGGLITFDIENGTFCNVIVSRELLDGPFRVSVDNSITASALYWDTNNTFAMFTCNARNREVEIVTKIRGDMNDDGVVNIIDLAWLAKQFGLKIQNP
jgi:parallel beta-helix repeat protein